MSTGTVAGAVRRALVAAEGHDRPGLPVEGFRVTRRAGEVWLVVLDSQGRVVLAPECRIQGLAPAPGGEHLAVELAEDGTEAGRLVLVEVHSGESRAVPGVGLRHARMAWRGRSPAELVVVDDTGRLLRVSFHGVVTALWEPDPPPGPAGIGRTVPIRIGDDVVLAVSRPDDCTTFTDMERRELLTLPAVRAVSSYAERVLVVTADELLMLDRENEQLGVRARAALPGTPTHALATPTGALVQRVREGHDELVVLDADLVERQVLPVSTDHVVRTVTGLSVTGSQVWVRHESPGVPPIVRPWTGMEGATGSHDGPGSRLLRIAADDGATIELVLTGDARTPAPLLLEAYGGFGVVDVPRFEPSVAAWCSLGGLHVSARVRGGGGAGSPWHEAARGARKGRAVADLVACCRALVDGGWTRPELLVLAGASHGGLLVASAGLSAPELVGGVSATAAPLDPMALEENPLAHAWSAEFGDPADPQVRAAMSAYSPLALAGRLGPSSPVPRFLLTTFDDDSRVSAASSDRLAALLRDRGADVTRVTRRGMGHGTNPLDAVHDFAASVLDFARTTTGATT